MADSDLSDDDIKQAISINRLSSSPSPPPMMTPVKQPMKPPFAEPPAMTTMKPPFAEPPPMTTNVTYDEKTLNELINNEEWLEKQGFLVAATTNNMDIHTRETVNASNESDDGKIEDGANESDDDEDLKKMLGPRYYKILKEQVKKEMREKEEKKKKKKEDYVQYNFREGKMIFIATPPKDLVLTLDQMETIVTKVKMMINKNFINPPAEKKK